MIKMTNALSLRKAKKRKNPNFIRQDAHKKPRVGTNWRKPRGLQSKMRLQMGGYRAIVKNGYRGPKSVRGFDPKGLEIVNVFNLQDLAKIDTKIQGALISSTVGKRNKIEIVKKAIELKVTLLNVKDSDLFIKEVEAMISDKKKSKKARDDKRKQKKKDLEKKAKEDAKKEDAKKEEAKEASEDEATKKDKEKKDIDKILTQKEM